MPEPEPAHDDHEADAETTAEAEADQPAEPANRAARRAKGKVASPQPHGKGQHFGGRGGSVQGPRQWGNRRSG
ncbi:hypothetical protein AB0B57_35355 [Micromonospora sp. NPDC049101]|uniref:hypothetical protein n=1 Tax=unclassified Micromonospora TaxID=2617518 RepID=UPI0033D65227